MLSYLAVFVGILCVVNASPQTSSGPLQCRNKFEVYACGSACQTTCATFNQPCPIVNIKCTDACYCIKGYARDQRGVCIPDTDPECERLKPVPKPPIKPSPHQCRRLPFEEFACGSACQTTCATYNRPCPVVNIKCNDACYCIRGYARNKRGVCIPHNSPECERLKPRN